MSTEIMYDTTLEAQAGSPAGLEIAKKTPPRQEELFHTTAKIGQDRYTIIFDPRNITPEEEDTITSLDRQIEGLNRVMGGRGRHDFSDQRQFDRALKQRLAVLGQITERGTQIFTDPVGNNPTKNNGLNRPPDEIPAPVSKKDNSSHTIFPAVNAMVAASLLGQPFIHDAIRPNTPQEIVQHAQSQTVAGLVGKFDANRAIPDKSGNYTYDIQQGDEVVSVTLTPLEVAFLDTIQKRIPHEDESTPETTRKEIFLPLVGNGAARLPVEPTDGPTSTATRRPTTVVPTPVRTERPSPTPPVIITTEPTPTTAPTLKPTTTPTEKPTATEAGPVTELALETGDRFIVLTGPSMKYAFSGTNGDEESGAKALGYTFESLTDPVLDSGGEYVVGTVQKDGQPMTIRIPFAQIDPTMLERIQQGNPEEDSRLGAEVVLWAGRDGKARTLVVNALGGDSLSSGFIGNYDNGAVFHISAQATGTAKTAIISFATYDRSAKKSRHLQLSYDMKGRWSILNGERDDITGRYSGQLSRLYEFPSNSDSLTFKIKGNILIIPKTESHPETQITIPYRLNNGLTYTGSDRTGTSNAQALIKINSARVRFLDTTNDEPVISAELSLPTLNEIANKVGKRIMANTRYLTAPADLSLAQHAIAISDPLSVWHDNTNEQTRLLDRNEPTAVILDIGMSDNEIIQIIQQNSKPNSIFQYGPEATSRGPIGAIFKADGSLVNKQQLRKILAEAKSKGFEVIINSDIAPDMKRARSIETTRFSRMIRALEELKALGAGKETTLMLAGDSEYIDTTDLSEAEAIEALRYALQSVQEIGVNVGLGNIVGPGDPNIENDIGNGISTQFYRLIGRATADLENVTLGFSSNLSPLTWSKGERMELFRGLWSNSTEEQTRLYSVGATILRDIFTQQALTQ